MTDLPRSTNLRSIPAAVAAAIAHTPDETIGGAPPAGPFLTISREFGSEDPTLYPLLIQKLNIALPHQRAWLSYDRELVEKVAADHDLAAPLVATLDQESHSWLDDLRKGLSVHLSSEPLDAFAIYRRVAQTVRALAKSGRVILVGRGGAFIARDMSHGVQVRLVAPTEIRVAAIARCQGISLDDARQQVAMRDEAQLAFYYRHWPTVAAADILTATFNTARIDTETLADTIVSLVVAKASAMSGAKSGKA